MAWIHVRANRGGVRSAGPNTEAAVAAIRCGDVDARPGAHPESRTRPRPGPGMPGPNPLAHRDQLARLSPQRASGCPPVPGCVERIGYRRQHLRSTDHPVRSHVGARRHAALAGPAPVTSHAPPALGRPAVLWHVYALGFIGARGGAATSRTCAAAAWPGRMLGLPRRAWRERAAPGPRVRVPVARLRQTAYPELSGRLAGLAVLGGAHDEPCHRRQLGYRRLMCDLGATSPSSRCSSSRAWPARRGSPTTGPLRASPPACAPPPGTG